MKENKTANAERKKIQLRKIPNEARAPKRGEEKYDSIVPRWNYLRQAKTNSSCQEKEKERGTNPKKDRLPLDCASSSDGCLQD